MWIRTVWEFVILEKSPSPSRDVVNAALPQEKQCIPKIPKSK